MGTGRTPAEPLVRSLTSSLGTQSKKGNDLLLTITAATPHPVQLHFDKMPSAADLRHEIDTKIPGDGYFDDVHGSAPYKRHLTAYFAEQIRQELAEAGAGA